MVKPETRVQSGPNPSDYVLYTKSFEGIELLSMRNKLKWQPLLEPEILELSNLEGE